MTGRPLAGELPDMTNRRTLLALLACALAGRADASEAAGEDERRALAAWINALPFGTGSKVTMLEDKSWAYPGTGARELRLALPQASDAVIEDFVRKNLVPVRLDIPWALLGPQVRLQVVDEATLDALRGAGDWWQRFYRAFPDAACLAQLSRIGMDAATGQAVLMSSIGADVTRGLCVAWLLQRVDGTWKSVQSKAIGFS